MTPWLSVVVPVLNEADRLAGTLSPLQDWRGRGVEVLVVDGGSTDASLQIAAGLADRVLETEAGRARQMNAGAAASQGRLLCFLHADSALDALHLEYLRALPAGELWGRFPVRFNDSRLSLCLVAAMMNLRSRLSGIATGDQGIFVSAALFRSAGGYPEQPLMEDIALSVCLKRLHWPRCDGPKLLADARRWQRDGVLRTILLMWSLRFRYWCGESPEQLWRDYYGERQ